MTPSKTSSKTRSLRHGVQSATPLAVVALRGRLVESRHAVDVVVVDADGARVASAGAAERLTFPRSAVKALQALALVESGAADAFGFSAGQLALACSSHSAEAAHVAAAADMLARAGRDAGCLECGAQTPEHAEDVAALVRAGAAPSAIHNNCSGKHSGFIAAATHLGLPVAGYVRPEHPLQREIAATLEQVTGAPHGPETRGVDGCAIPTYALPLDRLAHAFARFGLGHGVGPARATAMARLRAAAAAHPEMVAGQGRACTALMRALGARAFVKFGAEGVYIASLPELGLGVALKARDGAVRAAEAAVAEAIAAFLPLSEAETIALDAWRDRPILARNGAEVGRIEIERS